jgi:hypothetical protein
MNLRAVRASATCCAAACEHKRASNAVIFAGKIEEALELCYRRRPKIISALYNVGNIWRHFFRIVHRQ